VQHRRLRKKLLRLLQRREKQNNLLKTYRRRLEAKINLPQMRNRNNLQLQMRNNRTRKTYISIPPPFSLTPQTLFNHSYEPNFINR
jgi:hypothetical protein